MASPCPASCSSWGCPKVGHGVGVRGGPAAEPAAPGAASAVRSPAASSAGWGRPRPLILSVPHPVHAVCPRGLFQVFGPCPVAARLAFGCSRAGAGISGCFLCVCCFFSWAEHATGLCRSYEEKQSSLQESLRACSLRCECSFWGPQYICPTILGAGERGCSGSLPLEDAFGLLSGVWVILGEAAGRGGGGSDPALPLK